MIPISQLEKELDTTIDRWFYATICDLDYESRRIEKKIERLTQCYHQSFIKDYQESEQ